MCIDLCINANGNFEDLPLARILVLDLILDLIMDGNQILYYRCKACSEYIWCTWLNKNSSFYSPVFKYIAEISHWSTFLLLWHTYGFYDLSQAVQHWPASFCGGPVESQAILCMIYGGKTGTGTGSSASTLVALCHYYSTNAAYSFTHHGLYVVLFNNAVSC